MPYYTSRLLRSQLESAIDTRQTVDLSDLAIRLCKTQFRVSGTVPSGAASSSGDRRDDRWGDRRDDRRDDRWDDHRWDDHRWESRGSWTWRSW